MYRPLPVNLTIKESKIDGLGLFSKTKIEKNSFIGITHVKNIDFQDNYIRTPLGGFINHSDKPNCFLDCTQDWDDHLVFNIITKRLITEGEELLLNYHT